MREEMADGDGEDARAARRRTAVSDYRKKMRKLRASRAGAGKGEQSPIPTPF